MKQFTAIILWMFTQIATATDFTLAEFSGNCDNHFLGVWYSSDGTSNWVSVPLFGGAGWDVATTGSVNVTTGGKIRITCKNGDTDYGPGALAFSIKANDEYFPTSIDNNYYQLQETTGSSTTVVEPPQGIWGNSAQWNAKWIWTCGQDDVWDCGTGVSNTWTIDTSFFFRVDCEFRGNCDDDFLGIWYSSDGTNNWASVSSAVAWLVTGSVAVSTGGKIKITCKNADGDPGAAGLAFSIKANDEYFPTSIDNNYYQLLETTGSSNTVVEPPQEIWGAVHSSVAPWNSKRIWTCGQDGVWDCGTAVSNTWTIDTSFFFPVDFTLVSQALSWHEAEAYCLREHGSHLATIFDDAAAQELQQISQTAGNWVWIGLTDLDSYSSEGNWVFTDGYDCGGNCGAGYSYWYSNEPNDSGGEDCALLYHDGPGLNDYPCNNAFPFVCNPRVPAVDCEWSDWSDGLCSVTCGNGTLIRTRNISITESYGGNPCEGVAQETVTCVLEECPDCPNGVQSFDWDELTASGTGKPDINVAEFYVNEDDLSLNIVVELDYVGKATANNEAEANFGVTYVLDFEDYSAQNDKINEPGTCQNREASSFSDISDFNNYWTYSEIPQNPLTGIGTTSTLAYPLPSSDKWSMQMKDDGCDTIIYNGHFTWQELRDCKAFGGSGESYTQIEEDAVTSNLILTGVFYVNVVSPLWYGSTDSGYYRVYQLLSQPFAIAVNSSVSLLGSTGINLISMSIIAVYKQDLESDFQLILMTETSEYLKLTRDNGEMFEFVPSINNYDISLDTSKFNASNNAENAGCLGHKNFICSQLWLIEVSDSGCVIDVLGTDFSGTYLLGFTPQCRNVEDSYCSEWLADHTDIADGIILNSELEWKDEICDPIIFSVSLTAEMLFYNDSQYTNGSDIMSSDADFLYEVGVDRIYVEIRTDFPDNTLTIFNSELVNVWICTFPPGTNVPTSSSADALTLMGCFNSARDDQIYPLEIFPSTSGSDLVSFEIHSETMSNIVRFSFVVPDDVSRDRLYVHAQIEVDLQEVTSRRRVLLDLLDVETANQITHFGGQVGVTRNETNKQPQETNGTSATLLPFLSCFISFIVFLMN